MRKGSDRKLRIGRLIDVSVLKMVSNGRMRIVTDDPNTLAISSVCSDISYHLGPRL